MEVKLLPRSATLQQIYQELKSDDVAVRIKAIREVENLDYYDKWIFFRDFLKMKELDPDPNFRREAQVVFERLFIQKPKKWIQRTSNSAADSLR